MKIGNFEGADDVGLTEEKLTWKSLKNWGKKIISDKVKHYAAKEGKNHSAVDSRDVKLHYLYNIVKKNPTVENMNALQEELKHRMEVDTLIANIFPAHLEAIKLKTVPKVTDFDCLRSMIAAFETHCQKLDDYSLKWVSAFVAECEGLKSYPEAINHSLNRIQE